MNKGCIFSWCKQNVLFILYSGEYYWILIFRFEGLVYSYIQAE